MDPHHLSIRMILKNKRENTPQLPSSDCDRHTTTAAKCETYHNKPWAYDKIDRKHCKQMSNLSNMRESVTPYITTMHQRGRGRVRNHNDRLRLRV
mgnify:FL=1